MQKSPYLTCCNLKFKAKEYYIPTKNKFKKSLFFIDACPNCGVPIAEIRVVDYDGFSHVEIRRKGEAALRLREKYLKENKFSMSPKQTGSFKNEYLYYLDRGNIYNLNSRFISTHEDFILKT